MTQIDIAGVTFTADWPARTLRENAHPANRIRLQDDHLSDDKSLYLLLYDTKTRREIPFDESVTALNDTTVFLEIPNAPGATRLKATVTPWRQTNLPEVLAQNRDRIETGYWEADEDGPRRGRSR